MKPVLAHVITGLNTGGAEMMLARLLELHERSSFRPIVFCLTDEGPVADRIRALGIPVHPLGLSRGIPNPLVAIRLARALRRNRAVVVQSWLYHADLIGCLAARLARIPVAWGIHNSQLQGNAAGRGLRIVIQLCRRVSPFLPTCIVCVAESARTAHVELGYPSRKMMVIPNGFDLARFRPDAATRQQIRVDLQIGMDEPVIMIVGRFAPLKNHRLFVEAAGLVADRVPCARFVMVGDGLEGANPDLADWIDRTGHRSRFHLLGRRADMPDLLTAADVVALTSNTEAFPLAMGEAMATGVPCVSTDVGDARQLIGNDGRIVPVGDPDAFADALIDLIEQPAVERRALGERARARIEAEFDLSVIADRYDRLWHSLAAGERPCG
jgi:glycosyltransferase involved in cell wall biosynthesis